MAKDDYVKLILLVLTLLGIQASPELTQLVTDLINQVYEIICLLN